MLLLNPGPATLSERVRNSLSKSLFRISTMGNVSVADMTRLLACFSRLLQ